MVVLFHLDREAAGRLAIDLRVPLTDAMETLGLTIARVFWDRATPAQLAARDRYLDMERAERARVARLLFEARHYERVAVVEGDPAYAFKATQNRVLSHCWSLEPPPGVVPCEPSSHLIGGRRYGRKSTETGDLMLADGRMLVVEPEPFSFAPVPMPTESLGLAALSTKRPRCLRTGTAR